ncbi:MAG: hypothetical protein M1435_01180 [Actinobacteria bacterium]|nr:hypothetical protein [Actinomycetota bacterium]
MGASVLIADVCGDDPVNARAEVLLTYEVDDDFGANTVTLAEVLVVPARQRRLDELQTVLADLQIEESRLFRQAVSRSRRRVLQI